MEETMNYEELGFEPENEEVESGNSGIGTGAAIAIGAGLAFATTAIVKLVKKAVAKHKANKELRQPDEDRVVEPSDEQIMELVQ